MDRTPDSIQSSSRSQQGVEGTQPLETTTSFSPVPMTASQRGWPSTEIGLGIFDCSMEYLNSPLRVSPPSEAAFTISATPNQLAANDSYEFPFPVDDLSNESNFVYGSGPNPSESPLSLDSFQSLSLSSAHSSAVEFFSSQEAFPNSSSELWAPTPCSEVMTPSEVVAREDDSDARWARELFSDDPVPVTTPMTPVTNSAYYPTMRLENAGNAYTGQLFAEPRGPSVGEPRRRAPSWPNKTSRTPAPPGLNLQPASGVVCPVCRYRFTRRSNCQEHMKRHDPDWRKGFACNRCPKLFGRNTDLKRHVNSIHLRIRKYYCQGCNLFFSRPETLNKHATDGCPPHRAKAIRATKPSQKPPSAPNTSSNRVCKRWRLMPRH